jgi:DNA-directed RNA polymerase specialized sigma24 family protein
MRRNMATNKYGSLLAPQQIRLINSRARRLGLPRHEWEDTQQEVAVYLMDNSSGDVPLTTITDGQLKMMLRAKARRRVREGVYRQRSCATAVSGDAETALAVEDKGAVLALDVRDALECLSADERAVCLALGRGDSVSEIARRLGCGRKAVRLTVAKIQHRLRALGLHQWLDA